LTLPAFYGLTFEALANKTIQESVKVFVEAIYLIGELMLEISNSLGLDREK
jgi:hypothetical protein